MPKIYGVVFGLMIAAGGWTSSAQVSNTLPPLPDEHAGSTLAFTDKKAEELPSLDFIPATIPDRTDAAKSVAPSTFDFHLTIAPGGTGAGAGAISIVHTAPPRTPRIADKSFFLLNGLQLGTAIFDVELTQRCIDDRHCRETNPLMPSSLAGKLSLNIGLSANSAAMSYWLKKRESTAWWAVPVLGMAIHGVGIATGFAHQ